jgi:large subunit ribosomal protein L13
MATRSTKSFRIQDVKRDWLIIDAKDLVLGRIASQIALILKGKHKAIYTPHVDCGDNVIVINADKVCLTGKKLTDKVYFRHTGFAGGIKETTPAKIIAGKTPTEVVKLAVKRMLAKEGPLCRDQFSKLHVYAGSEHPHQAQQPKVLDLASKNAKNKKFRTN